MKLFCRFNCDLSENGFGRLRIRATLAPAASCGTPRRFFPPPPPNSSPFSSIREHGTFFLPSRGPVKWEFGKEKV